MRVRRAVASDGPRFLELVHELARYEKLAGPTADAEARLLRDAFGGAPRFDLFVAEDDARRVVGYAVAFETYSTFAAKPILYLEDVYVTPDARRAGVGRAFFTELAREALRRHCVRLSWVVLDWNVDAQRFYDRLGAKPSAGWLPYQLEGDALSHMARG